MAITINLLIQLFLDDPKLESTRWLKQGIDETLDLMSHDYSRSSSKKFWAGRLVSKNITCQKFILKHPELSYDITFRVSLPSVTKIWIASVAILTFFQATPPRNL